MSTCIRELFGSRAIHHCPHSNVEASYKSGIRVFEFANRGPNAKKSVSIVPLILQTRWARGLQIKKTASRTYKKPPPREWPPPDHHDRTKAPAEWPAWFE